MKNILLIHHGWGYGGALIALLGLIDELKETNNITVLCIFNSDAIKYIEETGVKVVILQGFFYERVYSLFIHSEASFLTITSLIKKIYAFITFLFSAFFFSKKILSKFDYDLLYLNSLFLTDWAVANKNYKKVILHVREPLKVNKSLYTKIIRYFSSKYVTKIIAVSKDNAIRLNLNNTSVVYDPVVHNIDKEKEIYTDPKYNYFTYLGGTQRIKGFEQMVKCLSFLDHNVKVFFLGPVTFNSSMFKLLTRFVLSPYSIKERYLMRKLKKSDKVLIIGTVEDVWGYLVKSKALISPFAKAHASLPILESFSIGKPVIASDTAGTEELVEDKLNGYIFKNGDYEKLADCINCCASMKESEISEYRKNAKQKYLEILSKNNKVSIIINNIYANTL